MGHPEFSFCQQTGQLMLIAPKYPNWWHHGKWFIFTKLHTPHWRLPFPKRWGSNSSRLYLHHKDIISTVLYLVGRCSYACTHMHFFAPWQYSCCFQEHPYKMSSTDTSCSGLNQPDLSHTPHLTTSSSTTGLILVGMYPCTGRNWHIYLMIASVPQSHDT